MHRKVEINTHTGTFVEKALLSNKYTANPTPVRKTDAPITPPGAGTHGWPPLTDTKGPSLRRRVEE